MIEQDNTGKYLLSFETNAIIRRIPLTKYGTAKNGNEWSIGSILLEAYDEDENASAELFLIYWNDELMAEQIERLGCGKRVKVKWHVETKAFFDNYKTSLVLDDIEMLSDGENYLIGKKKGEKK